MKKIIVLLMLAVSTMSVAQEKSENAIYQTEEYQQIKKYYLNMVLSGKLEDAEQVRKQFLDKLGRDNFKQMSTSGLSMDKWLEKNIKKTNFKSIEEANTLLAKMNAFEQESIESRKEILPLIKKITDKVGHVAYTKQLQEDLKAEIKL
ncbi:hypothetical protein MG290_06660 [Flavobacterium sp. CBA20B-1]|uniref:hypothetical protein n=1 Tax=unclassified Flavobacterium TaxID=196869 RepID=UPI0022257F14|nr:MULTISPECIES: hypothetical protein [unclassified Flavobacterium]WCM43337.1 hypothetical protein MG290_06660 [Flavobacterium sp. CBA20B-1]